MGGVKQCEDFGKVCAYGLYIAGGSVVIGLARLVVSVAKLAINFFTSKVEEKQLKAEKAEAKKGGWLDQIDAKLIGVEQTVTRSVRKAQRSPWEDQAVRGLIEMIPVIGAAYFTHQDWRGAKKAIHMNKMFGWHKFNSAMEIA